MNAENVENCGLFSKHPESATAVPSVTMLVDNDDQGMETNDSAKYENAGATTTTPTKRKTRRFKSKFKNKPDKKSKYLARRISGYPQSEAPYNTNQFLMADHKLATPPMLNHADEETTARNRDSSFTNGDSDDDEFYAAPELEDEFLTKDFDDTYQTLSAERLGNLSKTQLTKIILDYETKVEELSRKLRLNESCQDDSINRVTVDRFIEENTRLRMENAELKQLIRQNALHSSSCGSSSSFTSESDSTTVNESRIRV